MRKTTKTYSPIVRLALLAGIALFLSSVVAAGGCHSSSTPSVGPSPSPTPIPSISPGPSPSVTPTANYFVGLDYNRGSIPPTTDPTYGKVQGFAPLVANPLASTSPSPSPIPTISSQIVTVHCNQNIQFFNLDNTSVHTASSLGPSNGMNWPPWNNTNNTFPSPLLTAISYPNFSAGLLNAFRGGGFSSLVYSTGPTAGSYYFGDYYDYNNSPQMRTVINILCP